MLNLLFEMLQGQLKGLSSLAWKWVAAGDQQSSTKKSRSVNCFLFICALSTRPILLLFLISLRVIKKLSMRAEKCVKFMLRVPSSKFTAPGERHRSNCVSSLSQLEKEIEFRCFIYNLYLR